MRNTMESFSRKRQFDVESLLRPDDSSDERDGPFELKRPRPLCSPASSSQSPSPLPFGAGGGGTLAITQPPPKASPPGSKANQN
ncbi:AGAP000069-PA-like protein [Anopheles sinensis]|uniref:AGAP000069-PA-like protein n=1 Tax=Anopheles sinensis TaxID=74873 RepID=A0A084WPR3_ANOSI|nr:AGAP000069-PA-like protein [Anopheles sinensis]